MSKKDMKRAFLVFLTLVIGAACALFWLYQYSRAYPSNVKGPSKTVTVLIKPGTVFLQAAELLAKEGAIDNVTAFRIYAHYRGSAHKIKAGEYVLKLPISPEDLLAKLIKGVPEPEIRFTIPEGKHMLEVAEIIHEAKVAKKDALLKKMRDRAFLKRIGVPGKTMEGYLFPDTYQFPKHSRAETVLEAMFKRHRKVFVQLRRKHGKKFKHLRKHLGWSHKEVVTLASIVEKETGQAFERPRIAGVFFNRLNFRSFQPKLLQTDPTIIYGCTVPLYKSTACQSFKGRIRRIHLRDKENPYNTYTQLGLPPTPIANPGKAAIEAALNPEKHRYLFFVSRNDGTHVFSTNERDHEAAVDVYQRKIKRKP